jgi:sensor histidine kinase regulating citrate/malate metabolism
MGKYEQAKAYVNDLVGDIQVNNKAIMIQHPVLAALIYSKFTRFRQSNVDFDINIQSDAIVEHLSITDSVRLLTNLLDNAFDEVSNLIREERKVSLELSEVGRAFTIDVSNPTHLNGFNQKLFQTNQTTKSSGGNRGYGLSIVQDIVKKYSGQINVRVENNVFQIIVSIPKKGEYDHEIK